MSTLFPIVGKANESKPPRAELSPTSCLSVVMLSITLLFGLLKLQHLLERKNPEIVTNEVAYEPDDEEAKLDADDPEYMMAFAITNGILRDPKNDPNFEN